MRKISILFSVLIVVGCASQAPEPAPAPVQVASAATGAPPKQTCRKEAVIGSNFPQTVCYNEGDDPNDPKVANAQAELSRQMGLTAQMIGRAGKN